MALNEVVSAARKLGKLNDHSKTPADVLGMTGKKPSEPLSMVSMAARIEHLHIADLPDGSFLYAVDHAVYALMREGLPPGSIIETGVMSRMIVSQDQIRGFLSFATVAIILRHELDKTVLLGLIRKPRPHEQARGMRQGAWGSYDVDGTTYDEKDDARMALQRIFSPTTGIEGPQILSSIFQSKTLTTGGSEQHIREAGCISHEQPMIAIPVNVFLGIATPINMVLTGQEQGRIIRVRLTADSNHLSPLASMGGDVDEHHLLRMGLITRAEQIAESNPLGLGAGTDTGDVLEAMLETTVRLPEMAGNGASMRDAAVVFKQTLGLR